jgi:cytidyltransferase-like protein
MTQVVVSGAFDDLRSGDIRFLEEAARFGPVTVALWEDGRVTAKTGRCKFPFAERAYLLEAIRFVQAVIALPRLPARRGGRGVSCAAREGEDGPEWRAFCEEYGMKPRVIPDAALRGFPTPPFGPSVIDETRRRVIATGCYDWFHSGHVRFFEECSRLGDLYVVAGHDANVRLLKGEGHPLFPQEERRYIVSACRYVKHALVSSGMGWMDAEPEIALVKPHMYAVNEDGDKPEKRAFCAAHDIEYVVLKRTPKEGLPRRSSTDLRGF